MFVRRRNYGWGFGVKGNRIFRLSSRKENLNVAPHALPRFCPDPSAGDATGMNCFAVAILFGLVASPLATAWLGRFGALQSIGTVLHHKFVVRNCMGSFTGDWMRRLSLHLFAKSFILAYADN